MFKIALIFLLPVLVLGGQRKISLTRCIDITRSIGEYAISQESHTKDGQLSGCLTPACQARKEKLIQFGYEPKIAERIAVYRPDICELVSSSTTQITPEKLIVRPDIASTFPRDKWFASQVQDRNLVTVYRGIRGSAENYDPEFYNGGKYLPQAGSASDNRIFTIDDVSRATIYPETETIILRMKIPKFMLYTSEGGPWGLVYFRDMVPNDLEFVTDVAFLKPGTAKDVVPNFIPLEEALPGLLRARISDPHQ